MTRGRGNLINKNLIFQLIYTLILVCACTQVHAQQPSGMDSGVDGKDKLYRILVKNVGLTKDKKIVSYVNKVADKIVIASKSPLTYKETLVVNTPEIIALTNFHYVFLSTGLIALLSDEAELAAVISHEIAHIASDHKTKLKNLVHKLLDYQEQYNEAGYDKFASDLSKTYVLLEIRRNRRQFEKSADQTALNFLLSGNYNPYAYISALKKLELIIDNTFSKKNEQNKIISDLLSTHPPIKNRMKNVNQLLDSYNAYPLNSRGYKERFMANIDGMTLFSGSTGSVPAKYIIRYVRSASLKKLNKDDELLEYILLINQANSLKSLADKERIKRVYIK